MRNTGKLASLLKAVAGGIQSLHPMVQTVCEMSFRLCFIAAFLVVILPMQARAATTCVPATPVVCTITGTTGTWYATTPTSGITYAWNDSTATSPRGMTIGIQCSSTYPGFTFTAKDEVGTAAQYPITITTYSTDTIDCPSGSTTCTSAVKTYVLNSNFQSVTLQCDGVSNWMVE